MTEEYSGLHVVGGRDSSTFCSVETGRCALECDTVIFNKKYVFGLHPISGIELQKPL